jgi:hypothetical protein
MRSGLKAALADFLNRSQPWGVDQLIWIPLPLRGIGILEKQLSADWSNYGCAGWFGLVAREAYRPRW